MYMWCKYCTRIVVDRFDLVMIERMIKYDDYLAYLVINDHKNEHKPTRFVPIKVIRVNFLM
jgi:hypothetical protein